MGSHGSHSQVLLLRVGNLTEVGGHFKAHTDSTFWVGLGSHGFNGFNKKVNKTTSQQVNEFVELIRVQWKGRGDG